MKFYYFLFLIYFINFSSYSQNKKLKLNIVDSENNIIDNVTILSSTDSGNFKRDSLGFYYLNDIKDSIDEFHVFIYNENFLPIDDLLFLKDGLSTFSFVMQKSIALDSIVIDYNKPIIESNKITYRINKKLLLNNSDVHDALKTIPFIFQRIENNKHTYLYKNKAVTVFINGDINNNNIVIPDVDLIEKIEFYPLGNAYFKGGNSPIINIILKNKEIKNRGNIMVKTTPLINDNLLSYNLLYSNKNFSISLPFNAFNTKYISKINKLDNYSYFTNNYLEQTNKENSLSLRPTVRIKINKKSSLTTTTFFSFKDKKSTHNISDKEDSYVFDSENKNIGNVVFLSSTYEYLFSKKILSVRGFWGYNQNNYKRNTEYDHLKNTTTEKNYIGDISLRESGVKWNNSHFDYRLGYSSGYTDNNIFGDDSKYNSYNFSQVLFGGGTFYFNDLISLNAYLSYNLIKRNDDNNNFILPNLSVSYKLKDDSNLSLSYSRNYVLPKANYLNENIEYDYNNNIIVGDRALKAFKKDEITLDFTSLIGDLDYSLNASYIMNSNQIVNIPFFNNNELHFKYENNNKKSHAVDLGLGMSKSFIDNKLFVQLETKIRFNKLKFKGKENYIAEVSGAVFSYETYLKWILNNKSSLELSSYWDNKRIELFRYVYENSPMISLAYNRNIFKDLTFKIEAYTPLMSMKENIYRDNFYQMIENSSHDLDNLKFISFQLRYVFGNKKIRNIMESDGSILYEK